MNLRHRAEQGLFLLGYLFGQTAQSNVNESAQVHAEAKSAAFCIYSIMGSSLTSGTLFPIDNLPEGLLYQPDFLSPDEEADLVRIFRELPFQAFDFHGYTAKRRVLEFGLEYDFTTRRATPTQSFPEFLSSVRDRAANFAGISAR